MSLNYLDENWKRLVVAGLIAFHIFGRPVNDLEPVKREDILSLNKLMAEGMLSEKQTSVGTLTQESL